jgi:hypothetical protein
VEPEPQGAELLAGARARAVYEVSAPAPGQTELVLKIIIHIEKDQASKLSRYSFLKNMKNPLFN